MENFKLLKEKPIDKIGDLKRAKRKQYEEKLQKKGLLRKEGEKLSPNEIIPEEFAKTLYKETGHTIEISNKISAWGIYRKKDKKIIFWDIGTHNELGLD